MSAGYQLKIESAFDATVYRIVEIDEEYTFEDLSYLILELFEFDYEHLYMFSLKRKPYDPEGIYEPSMGYGTPADEVSLKDVGANTRNKYLYLYDFGDEWMFYITIQKKIEVNTDFQAKVIKTQGKLCQYPNWEDDMDLRELEEDDIGNDMMVTGVQKQDEIIIENLRKLPAVLQQMWIYLVENVITAAGDYELEQFALLEKAELLEIEESGERLSLRVFYGEGDFRQYDVLGILKKRYNLEQTILSLVGFYGVIEKSVLHEILCEYSDILNIEWELVEEAEEKLGQWNCLKIAPDENQGFYFSSFCSEITKMVLEKRKQYPVKRYKELVIEDETVLLMGNGKALSTVYGETFQYLFLNQGWNPVEAEQLLDCLVTCIAIGYTKEEYQRYLDECFEQKEIVMTKTMEKKLLKFREEFPSAVLKGYTWGEYEKDRTDGYHQLSLFEEELPFS